jgi:alpha-ketoglutarate-dependent 2,4-dichlorophenoxyacetate dioxygenase
MTISALPLHPLFVGQVSGIDLRHPVDADTVHQVSAALDHHAVLVFRDQQIAFSRLFGRLETSIGTIRKGRKLRLSSREIADVSNLDENNAIRLLGPLAHDDPGEPALAY